MRLRSCVALLAALSCAPAALAELTPEQWRQDLKILASELPRRHKNLFFHLKKAEFYGQVRELDEAIPKLSEMEIRAALVRLLASVGNAHTTINGFQDTPNFPLLFSIFPDGVYVTAAPREHPRAVGARLLAVNGKSVEEVRRRLLPYFARENDTAPLVQLPGLLRTAAALKAAGITGEMDKAEFDLERDGARFALELRSGLRVETAGNLGGTKPPLYRSRRGVEYWFGYLAEAKTVYVQYNVCRNMAGQSFKAFTDEVMKAADANAVKKFVVDLRFNGGGNSTVINPLVSALKSRRGMQVYALVGRNTFSSGFMAAQDLQKHSRAVLVGEAMGQRPNSYGDIRPLKLPNSGLTAYYCTKYFRRAKGDPPAIEPDVPVSIQAADYFNGRDPVMNYVLSR